MARDQLAHHERLRKAHSVFVRLVFPAYTVHFKSPTYVRDTTLDLLDKKVCKETLKSTAQDASIRVAIGTDTKFWVELAVLFKAAIPSLERRSFTIWDPSSVDYESTSGALIASNYPGLWKDLERLNDLVSISRNVLTIGAQAQDLAAAYQIDTEIFRLINCCVRVTARGYDGEAGTGEEEKWQWIVNAYKKLLITSLQFLNNLGARNERRKLMLWLALFDIPHTSDGTAGSNTLAPEDIPETSRTTLADVPSNPNSRPEPPISIQDILIAYGTNGYETLDLRTLKPKPVSWQKKEHQTQPLHTYRPPKEITDSSRPFLAAFGILIDAEKHIPAGAEQEYTLKGNGYVFFGARTHATTVQNYRATLGREPTLTECYFELARQWTKELREQDREYWAGLYEDAMAKWRADNAVYEAKVMAAREVRQTTLPANLEAEIAREMGQSAEEETTYLEGASGNTAGSLTFGAAPQENLQDRIVVPDDLKMLFTASAGARILESGKSELLKRLEGYGAPQAPAPAPATATGGMMDPANIVPSQPAGFGGEGEGRTRSMSRSPGLDRRVPRREGEMEGWGRPSGAGNEAGRRERPLVGRSAPSHGRGVGSSREEVAAVAGAAAVNGNGNIVENGQAQQQTLPPLLDDPAGDDGLADEEELESEGEGAEDEDEGDPDEEGVVDEDEEEEPEDDEEDEEEEEEEEDDEEDYPGSTEDGRGLLTDVPLILGPSEIEVLPMLIMSGIVPPPAPSDGNTNAAAAVGKKAPTPTPTPTEQTTLANLHTIRTHILLSHSTGRNLLRELLIFVAAWDLREEELYFKFMVKIMESILRNGLMPYAYHSFRDRSRSKDIISPAQAVIMKLLTCIFRGRGGGGGTEAGGARGVGGGVAPPTVVVDGNSGDEQANITTSSSSSASASKNTIPVPGTHELPPPDSPATLARRRYLATLTPSRTDLHTLNFIFTEFRQHIIPQTCALIFLQQQIHAGRASPEDFPLNLWDMERMYEGVYQYLEFFAVLTEEGVWKGVLGEWEGGGVGGEGLGVGMGSRKRAGGRQMGGAGEQQVGNVGVAPPVVVPGLQRSLSADAALPTPTHSGQHSSAQQLGGASEQPRPTFDRAGTPDMTTLPPLPLHPPPPPSMLASHHPNQPIFEAETPLAYPEDNTPILGSNAHLPLPHPSHSYPPAPALHANPGAAGVDQDEPSDFEWRNLKKLAVLVLSSLIWKNRKVQDQVREYGGLEALVSCCRHDENNPYIREHAIMCLRFAVEGCEVNGEVIRGMAGARRNLSRGERGGVYGTGTQGGQQGGSLGSGGRGLLPGGSVTLEGEVGDVPQEVLDTSGYETFMDGKGQVGLRRKGDQHQQGVQPAGAAQSSATYPPPAGGPSSSSSAVSHHATTASGSGVSKHQPLPPPRLSATKMTAEKAAELMQNALRDLPLGDKLVTDKQKAEALAKLDRAFESTEKVLGRGRTGDVLRNNMLGNGGGRSGGSGGEGSAGA